MIEIPQHEIPDMFPSEEGQVNLYYGLIRSGKTYAATADIHEEIAQGHTVYATWPIHLEDTDDRNSLLMRLRAVFLPWKKRFFYIPASKNFHYINAMEGTVDGVRCFMPNDSESYIKYLNTLNHCSLYIDEAWRIMAHQLVGTKNIAGTFDLILVTGHKFRTVNLIAQRTITIQPTARSQVGRFYKCEKLGSIFGFLRFMRSEYQVMKGDDVIDDDDENYPPISVKTYWGRKKIFESYNSWYFGDLEPLHPVTYWAYDFGYWERVKLLFGFLPRTRQSISRPEGATGEVVAERRQVSVSRSDTVTRLQITR